MNAAFDEERFISALHDRVLGDEGFRLVGILVNAAGLHSGMFKASSAESIRFQLLPGSVRSLKPPEFHRLVLVLPESFEFSWLLSVSGHFLVTYKSIARPVPRPAGSLKIYYAGIIVKAPDNLIFKSEHIKLA